MLATAVGTRLDVHLIHEEITAFTYSLATPAQTQRNDPELSDFHELIPGDIQLVSRVSSADEDPDNIHVEYTALVRGIRMTARLYEGPAALENWRQDFLLFSRIRDPHILQLYGYCRSPRLPALVFHDELSPVRGPGDLTPGRKTLSGCLI
ncbi:hypothetical protein B0H10DRAFT_291573 [Mycena sp. CBHHK59/15]|nr:hypothetical protein B0H10DRAFT_291573 [Mycena sp. CBHHK59/15]